MQPELLLGVLSPAGAPSSWLRPPAPCCPWGFSGEGPAWSCGAHELPAPQVETLTSLKALGRYVDSSQVTAELDGTFPYCHGEWVQFFQVSVITPSAVSSPSRGAPLSPRLKARSSFCASRASPGKQ